MATQAFEDIAETFEFLDDWEDRYRHVIELGRAMPPMDAALKTPATKVEGCASQVWIQPILDGEGPQAQFDFYGDSDAMIVRGLIAVLHALYAGLRISEVTRVDAMAELARLGLDEHLSSQRSNGLRAMVTRIQSVAAQAAVS
jgi:cysteine desulfuration protein SufE